MTRISLAASFETTVGERSSLSRAGGVTPQSPPTTTKVASAAWGEFPAYVAVLSALGIFLIVYADFASVRLALLIMLSLPIALTGSIGAAWFAGGVVSLGSIVGFVTVLGIVARNGIMLISHYRHLEIQEGMPFGEELIVRGAMERLSPILMTTLAMALALVPIVVGGSRPGHEIENPMAIVILGGLFTSTLLNLLFMPALYWRFAGTGPDKDSR